MHQVFLRVLCQHTAVVDVADPATFTIEDVKRVVESRHGLPLDDQRLSFGGRPLVDDLTLEESGVGR